MTIQVYEFDGFGHSMSDDDPNCVRQQKSVLDVNELTMVTMAVPKSYTVTEVKHLCLFISIGIM